MKADSEIAIERVQSESLGTLMSLHCYKDIEPHYFQRLRDAVSEAVTFFQSEDHVPAVLIDELELSAQVLRNEATVFPGRTSSCVGMADWLDEQRQALHRP
jgi:hypothetical protein